MLSYLCDNACKICLALCLKGRALCPVSRLLSVPIQLAYAEWDVNIISSINQADGIGQVKIVTHTSRILNRPVQHIHVM